MAECDSGWIDSRKYDDVMLLGRILCQLNAFAPLTDTIRVKILKHFEKPKHGRWLAVKVMDDEADFGETDGAECSVCGYTTNSDYWAKTYYHYCPNCGARMDGGEQNESEPPLFKATKEAKRRIVNAFMGQKDGGENGSCD